MVGGGGGVVVVVVVGIHLLNYNKNNNSIF
jgi:hypothetical protein